MVNCKCILDSFLVNLVGLGWLTNLGLYIVINGYKN